MAPRRGLNDIDQAPETSKAAVLEQLLAERWSCRAFDDRPVPAALMERMFCTAQQSASWCNTQPWHLIVTQPEATNRFRNALSEHVAANPSLRTFDFEGPSEYRGIYKDRRRESGWQLYEAVGIQRGDRNASRQQAMRNYRMFDAPHVAIITTDAGQNVYGAVDAGLYIGTLLLVAHSLGIGAVAQAALAGQSDFIRDYFSMSADRKILAGISFGFPDLAHPANQYRTARATVAEVVTWVE